MNLNLTNALTLLSEKITTWYEQLIKSIPNLVVALIVFISFFILAKMTKKLSLKLLPRVTKNKAVLNLLKTIVYVFVILIGVFISLEILNLDKTVTSILAGAGVLGLALGFAFQEITSNFISGIFIAFREPYKLGDIVKIHDYFGEVTGINLRTTSITTFQGLEVIIPNKDMFTEPFINFTTTPQRRLDISVGVSYSDNLETVEKVTKECLEGLNGRVKDKEVEVYFEGFGASSINLSARVWINYPANKNYVISKHQAIMNIKSAYDQNGISIPFPIRTLEFNEKVHTGLVNTLQKDSNSFVQN